MPNRLVCTPKTLPPDLLIEGARIATRINPVNHPPVTHFARLQASLKPTPERIAVMTTKYWHAGGVHLTVGFLDNPASDLRAHILFHMNAWATSANVAFVETAVDPQVRIARAEGPQGGYWSYLGTDILSIAADKQTMNLEGFTMNTPESEFIRVVRHETGHTMGFPHEHMRKELIARIDPDKAIPFFEQSQGWSEAEVIAQVLTPLDESSLLGTTDADEDSIMCYQIPGTLTRDGAPIEGGVDIDASDYAFAAQIYPKPDGFDGASVPSPNELRGGSRRRGAGSPDGSALFFPPGSDPAFIAATVGALRR